MYLEQMSQNRARADLSPLQSQLPHTAEKSLLPLRGCLHLPGTAPCSLLFHFSSWYSSLPTGLHICSRVAFLLLQNTSPQVLAFCSVCSLLYPQLHEQHSLSRTGFSEDLLSELAAGTCFSPAPPNRKHCTSRGVPNTAAGLLDASALLVLSPMHQWQRTLNLEIHVPTLLREFIHS